MNQQIISIMFPSCVHCAQSHQWYMSGLWCQMRNKSFHWCAPSLVSISEPPVHKNRCCKLAILFHVKSHHEINQQNISNMPSTCVHCVKFHKWQMSGLWCQLRNKFCICWYNVWVFLKSSYFVSCHHTLRCHYFVIPKIIQYWVLAKINSLKHWGSLG